MTVQQQRQTIEEDNNKLAEENLLADNKTPEEISASQVEEHTTVTAEDVKPAEVVTQEQTTTPTASNLLTKDIIERLAHITQKSIEFVENKFLGVAPENMVSTILDIIQDSCLSVHKYSIGDYVWIPEQTVDNTSGGFGPITVKFLRKPKHVQINKIIYTNKIQYSFVGFKKLIVLEEYCCDTEKQCQEMCNKLNMGI